MEEENQSNLQTEHKQIMNNQELDKDSNNTNETNESNNTNEINPHPNTNQHNNHNNHKQDQPKDSKKNIKSLSLEEQATYYKDQFIKTRKLFLHYEKEVKSLEQKNKLLNEKLKKYQPTAGTSTRILFKLNNKQSFFFLESSDGDCFFVKEDLIKDFFNENDLKEAMKSIESYDFEKQIKNSDETISMIIEQYDERVKRLKNENEKYEEIIMKNKEIKAMSVFEVERTRLFFEKGIKEVIIQLDEIKNHIKNVNEAGFLEEDIKKEVFSKLKQRIDDIKQRKISSNHINSDQTKDLKVISESESLFGVTSPRWILEIKDFILSILTIQYENMIKHQSLTEELYEKRVKFQNTIDSLIKSNEEEGLSKERVIESLKETIISLNQRISVIEQDKYNVVKLKDQQIEVLSKENNKKINVNMLKSVLIQIFTTSDQSIQDTVLPVIFTALKFSDGEVLRIKEYRSKSGGGGLFGLFKGS